MKYIKRFEQFYLNTIYDKIKSMSSGDILIYLKQLLKIRRKYDISDVELSFRKEQNKVRCKNIFVGIDSADANNWNQNNIDYDPIVVDFYDETDNWFLFLQITHKKQILKSIIKQLKSYELQKEILEEEPNKIKELEKFGLHPDIEKEFGFLLDADEMGLI